MDRVFVEHPLFERAACDIYGANYTYVDSDAGVADLDLRWSVLSQAALAAPVVLWPPARQPSPQPAAAPGGAEVSGKAAPVRPPEQWPALVAEAHHAGKQAAAERVAQQDRLALEAESLLRAQQAAEAAAQAAIGEAVFRQQPGQYNGGMPAPPRMQSETDGNSAAAVTPRPLAGAPPSPAVTAQKPDAGAAIGQQLAAAAEGGSRGAASDEQMLASEGSHAPADSVPEDVFEDSVIFVGMGSPLLAALQTPCSQPSRPRHLHHRGLPRCAGNDWPCAPLVLRLQHAVRAAQSSVTREESAAAPVELSEQLVQPHVAPPRPSAPRRVAADGRGGRAKQRRSTAAGEELVSEPHKAVGYVPDPDDMEAATQAASSGMISTPAEQEQPWRVRQEPRLGFWQRIGAMLRNAKVAFCIHNLAYQGIFPTVHPPTLWHLPGSILL